MLGESYSVQNLPLPFGRTKHGPKTRTEGTVVSAFGRARRGPCWLRLRVPWMLAWPGPAGARLGAGAVAHLPAHARRVCLII
jgi:hypothetical protein